jgi:hypothetical protein
MVIFAEASSADQLPQVEEWGGDCGPQVGACVAPYPCCSEFGKCGCTKQQCGSGCQAGAGSCAAISKPEPTTSVPTAPPVPVTLCGSAWIQDALAHNNDLRNDSGAAQLICDEGASRVAAQWAQAMCKYASKLSANCAAIIQQACGTCTP